MELNLRDTELCLGLPGGGETATVAGNKRGYSETVDLKLNLNKESSSFVSKDNKTSSDACPKPLAKAQVVGWPPVRSYRKNMVSKATAEAAFVKVSMDGAPYLRKIDLKMYKSYTDLSNGLATMFSSFTMGNNNNNNKGGGEGKGMIDFMKKEKLMDGLEYVPSYEDKDGDWMLVGDVPWEMFVESCKRVRIMKGSEAIGFAPKAMEKCESRT